MGIELAKAYVTIRGDVSALGPDLRAAKQMVEATAIVPKVDTNTLSLNEFARLSEEMARDQEAYDRAWMRAGQHAAEVARQQKSAARDARIAADAAVKEAAAKSALAQALGGLSVVSFPAPVQGSAHNMPASPLPITDFLPDEQIFATKLANIAQQIDNMSMAGRAAFNGAISFVLFRINHMGKEFLKRGSEMSDVMEEIEIELKLITGSAAEADAVLHRLGGLSEKIGMSVPELYQMSDAFIRNGKSAGQTVAILKLLGDASGGVHSKFKILASVYERMESGNLKFAGAFKTLSRHGIITLKDLQAHFGISEEAAKRMLKNGSIGMKEFVNIMKEMTAEGGRMHGALEAQANSSKNLALALQHSVDVLARWLYQPLDKYIAALTKEITKFVHWLTDVVKWGGETLSFMTAGVVGMAGLTATVIGLAAAFAALSAITGLTLLPLVGIIAGIVAAVVGLGVVIGFIVQKFNVLGGIAAIWTYIKSVVERSGIYDVFNNLLDIWDRLSESAVLLGQMIMQALAPVLPMAGKVGDKFIMTWVKAFVAPLKWVSEFVLEVSEWLQVILMNWESIWGQMENIQVLVFLRIIDVVRNAFNLLLDTFRASIGGLISLLAKMGGEINVIGAKILTAGMLSDERAAMMRAEAEGIGNNANAALGLDKRTGTKGLLDMSTETEAFIKASPLGKLFEDIDKAKTELEGKRRTRKIGEELPEEEVIPDAKGSGINDKAGIIGIDQLGKHLQDALLQKEDKVAGILEGSKKTQDDLLVEMRDFNRKSFALS